MILESEISALCVSVRVARACGCATRNSIKPTVRRDTAKSHIQDHESGPRGRGTRLRELRGVHARASTHLRSAHRTRTRDAVTEPSKATLRSIHCQCHTCGHQAHTHRVELYFHLLRFSGPRARGRTPTTHVRMRMDRTSYTLQIRDLHSRTSETRT